MCLSHPKFVLNGHAQILGSRHGLQCVSVEGVRTQKVPQKREFFIFAGVLPRQHLRNTEETLEVLSGSLSCSQVKGGKFAGRKDGLKEKRKEG